MEERIGICPKCGGFLESESQASDVYVCDTCDYSEEERSTNNSKLEKI